MARESQKKYWKIRQQARLIVANVGVSLFLKAQDHKCPICDQKLKATNITIDHVWPLWLKNENYGNIFLTHFHCNQEKADREPTRHEIKTLNTVNARLGYDSEARRYHCRQLIINKYYKMALWLQELNDREAPKAEIEKVQFRMLAMEDQIGYWLDN